MEQQGLSIQNSDDPKNRAETRGLHVAPSEQPRFQATTCNNVTLPQSDHFIMKYPGQDLPLLQSHGESLRGPKKPARAYPPEETGNTRNTIAFTNVTFQGVGILSGSNPHFFTFFCLTVTTSWAISSRDFYKIFHKTS